MATDCSVLGVIPTYGHLDMAKKAAESFLKNTPSSRVIIVDDGSREWEQYRDWPKWQGWPDLIHLHHFPKNDRNLTRSWNYGLTYARDLGAEYAVAANSDVIFADGWWPSVEYALNHGANLVGPLTNAPGTRQRQQIADHLPSYRIDDDPTEIARINAKVRARMGAKTFMPVHAINGFCMIAKTRDWWRFVEKAGLPFHPEYKMTRNEDELVGRWRRQGGVVAIVPGSFVFHYRGVSRGGHAVTGAESKGWYRPGKTKRKLKSKRK